MRPEDDAPEPGDLWDCAQYQRVQVGNKIATFKISGPALILCVQRNGDGFGDYYEILWGGKREEIIDRPPWSFFVERIS